MTRLTGTSETQSQANIIDVATLVKLGITGGTGNYLFTSSDGPVDLGADTYQPGLYTIGSIQERSDLNTTTRKVTISLAEQDLLTVLKTRANYYRKPVSLIDAMIQADGRTAIATGVWVGFISYPDFEQDEGQGVITFNCQGWESILDAPGVARLSDVFQQQRAPDVDGSGNPDTFFANMAALKGHHVVWGGKQRGGSQGTMGGGGDGGGSGNHGSHWHHGHYRAK